MNIQMSGQVIQAKRYSMDGNQGANLFLVQEADGSNPDMCGQEIMKLQADYAVVDQLRNHLPCECDIIAKPVAGAQQKMSFKVVQIKPKGQRSAA